MMGVEPSLHRQRAATSYRIWVKYVALATVASVPFSTSATSILVPVLAAMAIPLLAWSDLRAEIARPRSGLPILLSFLGIAGLLWSDADWHDRINGLGPFMRFLLLPIFAVYFQRSGTGVNALYTFLIACGVILVISLTAFWFPQVTFWRPGYPVVPFKDATTQSLECGLCAFGLVSCLSEARPFTLTARSAFASLLALLFVADIIYVATSRTELVAILVTLPLLAIRRWGGRGIAGSIICLVLISVAAWYSSANIRERVRHGFWEYQRYESLDQGTSIGARLEFWRRSIVIMSQAPLAGHGTGSIEHAFAATAIPGQEWIGTSHQTGTHVARTMVTPNPHNQTFAVGIQLGLIGIAVLYAMWAAQYWNFRGPRIVDTLGLVVIIQFVIGSIFYSYLFDFTEAWIFVLALAILYGMQTDASAGRTFP
jgi:O-antigen ligase